MKSRNQTYYIVFEAIVEVPGQPAEPSLKELQSMPSQYMKFTELQRRYFTVTWDNSDLDPDDVFKTHLKALKRKMKVLQAVMIDPGLLLKEHKS